MEAPMSDTNVVGSAEFELRANRSKLSGDMEAARREVLEGAKQTEGRLGEIVGTGTEKGSRRASVGIQELKGNLGALPPAAGAAATGLAGLATAAMAGVAAFVALVAAMVVATRMAFDFSFKAMRFADDMANTAKTIGVSTNALQEWRHVAQQTGATAADADRALDGFAEKLAKATAGTSKEAVKAFNFIGMDRETLAGFKSTEEALDAVTDKIKDLKNEADRAAVAEALGLGPLSAALRDSETDVARLRDEAHALGVVMDAEMIRRASKAQQEFDTLASVIDIQLKSAFIDLAPVILEAIKLVAQLATGLANALDQFRSLENKTTRGLERRLEANTRELGSSAGATGRIRAVPVQGGDYSVNEALPANQVRRYGLRAVPVIGPLLSRGDRLVTQAGGGEERQLLAEEHRANLINERARINAELAERRTQDAPPARTNRPEGSTLNLPEGRTPRTPVDRSAEREARRAERVEQEIFRARQRLLGIADSELQTVQERFDLENAQTALEREAEAAELESKRTRGEYTQAEYDRLKLINDQTAALEDRVASDILSRDLADERVANERLLSGLTADLVSLQIGAARTARERQRLELQLLEQTQNQRREDLRTQLDRNKSLTPEQRSQAMADNTRRDAMERDAVSRANLSPLQQWRDEALKTADEVAEAYESVAANGLDALNDGIVDAIMGTKTLGEVFSQVARQILADLLAISVRRGITEPLANAIFGGGQTGGAGGGGGMFADIFKSVLGSFGRRATGGPVFAGTPYIVGENSAELFIPSVNGSIVPKIGGTGNAASAQRVYVEVGVNDDRFNAYVDGRAAPVAAHAAATAYTATRNDQISAQRRGRQRFV
jgi:hypothetical protein